MWKIGIVGVVSAVVDADGDVVGEIGNGDVVVIIVTSGVDIDVDASVIHTTTQGIPILDAPTFFELEELSIYILTVIWA